MSTLLEAGQQPAHDPVVPVQQYCKDPHPQQSSSDGDDASYDVHYAQINWDDATSDEEPVVSIDGVILQLASASDPSTSINCLQQLTHTQYSIVGCDAWHQLLQLLPGLLIPTPPASSRINYSSKPQSSSAACAVCSSQLPDSPADSLATAAEQLLLQKLAPEVLDCSPEPLAELLVALLAASCCGSGWEALPAALAVPQGAPDPQTAAARGEMPSEPSEQLIDSTSSAANYRCSICQGPLAARAHHNLPSSVVQLIVVGLHKIARQWHYLDERVSQQLSDAIVRLLLEPLQLLLTLPTSNSSIIRCSEPWALQQGQLATTHGPILQQVVHPCQPQQHMQPPTLGAVGSSCCRGEQHEQQLKHHCCCVAEQLVLADPAMGWLHRMNACRASGRYFRISMASIGLVEQLRQWLEGIQLPDEIEESLAVVSNRVPAAMAQENIAGGSAGCREEETAADSKQSNSTGGLMHVNSVQTAAYVSDQQPMQHCLCVVYQLLSTLTETAAGRKLLAAAQDSAQSQQNSKASCERSCSTGGPCEAPTNRPPKSITVAQKPGEVDCTVLSAAVARLRLLTAQGFVKLCGEATAADEVLQAAMESTKVALDAFLQAEGGPSSQI